MNYRLTQNRRGCILAPMNYLHRYGSPIFCCIALILLSATLLQAQCPQCPVGAQCACINCSPCNSGSFTAMCACMPVAGKTTCQTQGGDCALGKCASCASTTGNQTCTFYAGCNGINCPTGGCSGGSGFRSSHVQISNSHPVPDGGQTWRLPYSINNSSLKQLKSIVTEWTIRSSDTGAETKFQRAVDSWVQGRRVAGPVATGGDDLRIRIIGAKAIEVTNIEILYAEYDDGTIEGAAADCVQQSIQKRRRANAESAKAIEAKIQAGVPIPELRKLLAQDPDLQYILIETVGGQSLEQILASARRIASQPK
jgi:hypothetical protein